MYYSIQQNGREVQTFPSGQVMHAMRDLFSRGGETQGFNMVEIDETEMRVDAPVTPVTPVAPVAPVAPVVPVKPRPKAKAVSTPAAPSEGVDAQRREYLVLRTKCVALGMNKRRFQHETMKMVEAATAGSFICKAQAYIDAARLVLMRLS